MWTYNDNYLCHHGVKGMKWKEHKTNADMEVGSPNNKLVKTIKNKVDPNNITKDNKNTKKKKQNKKENSEKKKSSKDSKKIVEQVINGKFGNGNTRVKALKKAGYNYEKIQNLVKQKLLGKDAAKRIAKRRAK